MNINDRLRRALHDRTASVDVDEQAALGRVTERLFSQRDDVMNISTSRNRYLIGAAAAALLVVAVAGGVLLRSGGGSGDRVEIVDPVGTGEDEETTTTTTDGPTTTVDTTEPPATTDQEDDDGEQPSDPPATAEESDPAEALALWPRPSSSVRFDDPVAAARSFAVFYAGFDDPIIGEFRAGDSRSGEVPVQARPGIPETTVMVRLSLDDKWYVIGSVTEDIIVEQPGFGDTLRCPMVTSGLAVAFEGTVQVHIDAYRPDGARVEVGRGFVTGSGLPPAGPFEDEINCTIPTGVEEYGIVQFWTDDASSELDGPIQSVTFPVRLR